MTDTLKQETDAALEKGTASPIDILNDLERDTKELVKVLTETACLQGLIALIDGGNDNV